MSLEILLDKGENASNCCDLNFVARKDNLYVIDNHLAAFWCWHQLDLTSSYQLLHVDRHYDLVEYFSGNDSPVRKVKWKDIPIDKITSYKCKANPDRQLIQWDNFIHLFRKVNPGVIESALFCTQREEDINYPKGQYKEVEFYRLFDKDFKYGPSWIFNIDIDYFFYNDNGDDNYIQLFTDDFIDLFGKWLEEEAQHAAQIIFCLSPEWCGGWEQSKRVANIILKHFGISI